MDARQEQWRQNYSDMLNDAAERWGVGIEGRPFITSKEEDERFHIPVVETLTFTPPKQWRWARNSIDLLELNGQWSYCFHFMTNTTGSSYGPCMKFCQPYPDRETALREGLRAFEDRMDEALAAQEGSSVHSAPLLVKALKQWLRDLSPEQLELFG